MRIGSGDVNVRLIPANKAHAFSCAYLYVTSVCFKASPEHFYDKIQ